MNYWIKRNHKRQSDAIIRFLAACTPHISFGMNLYGRSTHSIEIEYKTKSVYTIVRIGRVWNIRYSGSTYAMPEYNSKNFWEWLKVFSENVIAVESLFQA